MRQFTWQQQQRATWPWVYFWMPFAGATLGDLLTSKQLAVQLAVKDTYSVCHRLSSLICMLTQIIIIITNIF